MENVSYSKNALVEEISNEADKAVAQASEVSIPLVSQEEINALLLETEGIVRKSTPHSAISKDFYDGLVLLEAALKCFKKASEKE